MSAHDVSVSKDTDNCLDMVSVGDSRSNSKVTGSIGQHLECKTLGDTGEQIGLGAIGQVERS